MSRKAKPARLHFGRRSQSQSQSSYLPRTTTARHLNEMSYLPLPSTASLKASTGTGSRSRLRLIIIVGLFSSAALLYYHASASPYYTDPRSEPYLPFEGNENQAEWRPDLSFGKIRPGQPLRADPQAKPQRFEELPTDMPIRYIEDNLPVYAYSTLPTSEGDPWPAKPWITEDYLREDREVQDPPKPKWPSQSAINDNLRKLGIKQLNKNKMVPFEHLVKPEHANDAKQGMGTRKKLNRVQVEESTETEDEILERHRRKEWVERAIRHGWEGYKKHAWGHDEIKPLAGSFHDPFAGWGATIVDSLDLLLMLGWKRDYALARTHVQALDFTTQLGRHEEQPENQHFLPTFEVCIRYLGGFLSAYDLSGDELMLTRAKELGDWLMGAFNTARGLPMAKYRLGHDPLGGKSGPLILAEVGTMSMEYTRLAQVTGERKYFDVVQRVTDFFDVEYRAATRHDGLLPIHFQDSTTRLMGTYSFGGQADSYYEYLIKEYQLLGGGLDQYSRMYSEAIDTAHKAIVSEVEVVPGVKLLTIGKSTYTSYTPALEHLTCFAGAMLGLGAKLLDRKVDMNVAERFTDTCVWAYNMTSSGIAPESLTFFGNKDYDRYQKHYDTKGAYAVPRGLPTGVKRMDGSYKGRPETIESVFYMWRLTGDKTWQDKGWSMFHAFVSSTIVENGFAAISHVNKKPLSLRDSCESFVFAETLKYYWLLFSDNDVISLDEYVLNTEAHPFALRETEAVPFDMPEDIAEAFLRDGAETPIGSGTSIQQAYKLELEPRPTSAMKRPMGAGMVNVPVPDR